MGWAKLQTTKDWLQTQPGDLKELSIPEFFLLSFDSIKKVRSSVIRVVQEIPQPATIPLLCCSVCLSTSDCKHPKSADRLYAVVMIRWLGRCGDERHLRSILKTEINIVCKVIIFNAQQRKKQPNNHFKYGKDGNVELLTISIRGMSVLIHSFAKLY